MSKNVSNIMRISVEGVAMTKNGAAHAAISALNFLSFGSNFVNGCRVVKS